jgi:hypothetical protein
MPVKLLGTAALCLVSIGVSAAIVGGFLIFQMTGEINRKRDHDDQLPYFNLPPFSLSRMDIVAEYRRLYPTGRLHLYILITFLVAAVGICGALACIYLMGPVASSAPTGR